jgi:alkaline phosphatase
MFSKIRFLFPATIVLTISMHSVFAQQPKSLPNPKNIIILIGDGMGFNHIRVADYYLGTETRDFEQFPVRLAVAHYPVKAGEYVENNPASNYYATGYNPARAWKDTAYLKRDFTESAAAATALSTGFKTYNNAIGMSVDHDTLENLVQWAKARGKSAGVVTTVEFSHATPAGFVAHNAVRTNYSQIAYEMLLDSRCDVIMGCGDPMYDNDGQPVKTAWKDAKYVGDSAFWQQFISGSGRQTKFVVKGKTKTVRDASGDGKPDPWTVVRDIKDFRALQNGATPKRVLGCPHVYETLQQARTMRNDETKNAPPFLTPLNAGVPALAEMVRGALNVLDNNPNGFFVMIEGGATDWASHDNQKGRLIEEMKDFDEAVSAVIEWVNKHSSWNETMMIVTGDHETGLLWGEKPFLAPTGNGKGILPGMHFYSKNHTNSLIPFFAKGKGSELYRGFADECDSVRGPFIQNSEIPQLIHFLWPH